MITHFLFLLLSLQASPNPGALAARQHLSVRMDFQHKIVVYEPLVITGHWKYHGDVPAEIESYVCFYYREKGAGEFRPMKGRREFAYPEKIKTTLNPHSDGPLIFIAPQEKDRKSNVVRICFDKPGLYEIKLRWFFDGEDGKVYMDSDLKDLLVEPMTPEDSQAFNFIDPGYIRIWLKIPQPKRYNAPNAVRGWIIKDIMMAMERFLGQYPTSSYSPYVTLSLMHCYFGGYYVEKNEREKPNYGKAIEIGEAFLKCQPDHVLVPFFRMEVANAYLGLGDKKKAIKLFEELLEAYPMHPATWELKYCLPVVKDENMDESLCPYYRQAGYLQFNSPF